MNMLYKYNTFNVLYIICLLVTNEKGPEKFMNSLHMFDIKKNGCLPDL